jgi:hypothetical protein
LESDCANQAERKRARLSGLLSVICRLQAMQVVGRALRMRGCTENCPLVVFQNVKPGGDISGVLLAVRVSGRNRRTGKRH